MTTDPTTTNPLGDSPSPAPPTKRPRWDVRWVLAIAIVGSVALDQITKALAVQILSSGPVTFGSLRLHLIANRGILMGIPAPTAVIVLATIGVVVVALRAARRPDRTTALAYGLIAGGALGNLVDRLLERQLFPPQAVVDWISLGGITFNLADVFLIAGAATLLYGAGSGDSD